MGKSSLFTSPSLLAKSHQRWVSFTEVVPPLVKPIRARY